MKKLGLLVIHGMGTSRAQFDVKFKEKLYKRLDQLGKDTSQIAYQKVFWSEYINHRQNQYFQDIKGDSSQRIDWRGPRTFVIDNLGDASAYQRKHGQSNKNYFNIVRKIHRAVVNIKTELNSDDLPLIVAAHSLGGFIINNYIWDAHKIHAGQSVDWPTDVTLNGNFEKMINVVGMVTFGCNIPLFVIGNDPIEAIQFPHPDMDDQLKAKAKWQNFYDPDDVLGWPLKQLQYSFDGLTQPQGTKSYPQVVTTDTPIQVRPWLGWSPLSHINYWADKKLIHPSADYISQFL